MFLLVYTPYDIAFGREDIGLGEKYIEWTVTIFFSFDIVLNFFIGY